MSSRNFTKVEMLPQTEGVKNNLAVDERIPDFLESQGEPKEILGSSKLAIIGSGSVGWNCTEKAARLNIGHLFIVDQGYLCPENRFTHPISNHDAFSGKSKAESVAQYCSELGSATQCYYFCGPVEHLGLSDLCDVDVVILCTDNLAAEIAVSDRCMHLRLPLVQCSVHGESLFAQIRFFTNANHDSACIYCTYGEQERNQLNNDTIFSCSGTIGGQRTIRPTETPTMSTAFLCSLAADLGMTLVTRYLLKLGAPLTDSQTQYCGYTNSLTVTPLRKSDRCPCDHNPWEISFISSPLRNSTLRALSLASGLVKESNLCDLSFIVGNMQFVELGICKCGELQPVRKFLLSDQQAGNCRRCENPFFAHPFFSYRNVPFKAIKDHLDKPLSSIGVGKYVDSILIHHDEEAILFCESGDKKTDIKV